MMRGFYLTGNFRMQSRRKPAQSTPSDQARMMTQVFSLYGGTNLVTAGSVVLFSLASRIASVCFE